MVSAGRCFLKRNRPPIHLAGVETDVPGPGLETHRQKGSAENDCGIPLNAVVRLTKKGCNLNITVLLLR